MAIINVVTPHVIFRPCEGFSPKQPTLRSEGRGKLACTRCRVACEEAEGKTSEVRFIHNAQPSLQPHGGEAIRHRTASFLAVTYKASDGFVAPLLAMTGRWIVSPQAARNDETVQRVTLIYSSLKNKL